MAEEIVKSVKFREVVFSPNCFANLPKNSNSHPSKDRVLLILLSFYHCADDVLYPLVLTLFHNSLKPCDEPPEWNTWIVSPIPKSGLLNEIENHEPSFNLQPLSLAFQHTLRNFLVNKLIPGFIWTQLGFEPKKSLVTQPVVYIEEVLTAVDSGNFTAADSFDYAKVLDSVRHSSLIKTLCEFGMHQDFGKLISSFVSIMYQCVRVRQQFSYTVPISSEQYPRSTSLCLVSFPDI